MHNRCTADVQRTHNGHTALAQQMRGMCTADAPCNLRATLLLRRHLSLPRPPMKRRPWSGSPEWIHPTHLPSLIPRRYWLSLLHNDGSGWSGWSGFIPGPPRSPSPLFTFFTFFLFFSDVFKINPLHPLHSSGTLISVGGPSPPSSFSIAPSTPQIHSTPRPTFCSILRYSASTALGRRNTRMTFKRRNTLLRPPRRLLSPSRSASRASPRRPRPLASPRCVASSSIDAARTPGPPGTSPEPPA
jgi:hypothetical protein